MEQDVIDALADAVLKRASEKAAGTTPGTNFVHGPGGILAQPGQRATVVNAMLMPFGLSDMLPAKRSVFANEVYPILTGQTAATGSNPSTACGDCKQPGNLKVCNQTWPFGRWCLDSQVIQIDRLGLLVNRSEFVDQNLVGNPFAQSDALPGTTWNPQTALRDEKSKQILQMFVDWKRLFNPLIWTGNPANNSGTGYAEPYGLNFMVNTGYKDAYTGVACPSADPRIVDFASAEIGANAASAVTNIIELYADRKYLADLLGLGPVNYAWVGRYSLFRKLTEIWPCSYYSSRCIAASASTPLMMDATEMSKLRDDMRQNHYLLIDGEKVDFIIDNTIGETIPTAGQAVSDLFLLPLSSPAFSHNPGGAILYWEFFDMTQPVNIVNAGVGPYPPNSFQVLGGGRFLLYPKAPSNTCIQYGMLAKQRLILEAPFLAGRISNMKYVFQFHEREWDPNAPYYHYDGGQYTFTAPYFYPPRA
jgi:hypothetical protein